MVRERLASYKHQLKANLIPVGCIGQSAVEECQLTKSSTSQFNYCVRELMTTHENHEGVAATQFRRPCDKRLNFINDTLGGAQSEQWGESPPLSTESVPDSASSTFATAAARECVSQKAVGVSEGNVICSCGRGTTHSTTQPHVY